MSDEPKPRKANESPKGIDPETLVFKHPVTDNSDPAMKWKVYKKGDPIPDKLIEKMKAQGLAVPYKEIAIELATANDKDKILKLEADNKSLRDQLAVYKGKGR